MTRKQDSIQNTIGPFAIVPIALLHDATVSDRALRVWVALASYASPTKPDCWPFQAAIAERLGVSEPTVRRGIGELIDAGWLTSRPRFAEDGKHRKIGTIYTVVFVSEAVTERADLRVPKRVTERADSTGTERADLAITERAPVARSNRNRTDQGTDQGIDHPDDAEAPSELPGMPSRPRSQRELSPLVADAHSLTERVFANRHPRPVPQFLNVRALAVRLLECEWPADEIEAVMLRPDTVFTLAGLETARAKTMRSSAYSEDPTVRNVNNVLARLHNNEPIEGER